MEKKLKCPICGGDLEIFKTDQKGKITDPITEQRSFEIIAARVCKDCWTIYPFCGVYMGEQVR